VKKMARFWNKINLILEDCRNRIRAEVKRRLRADDC